MNSNLSKRFMVSLIMSFTALFFTFTCPGKASAVDFAYIGEIRMFAGNFAPQGWRFCDGSLLEINSNQALFAILGVTYGGNGTTTFALPDLRGRMPLAWGNGSGLTPRSLGEKSGAETVTLLTTQMPAHTHSLSVSSSAGGQVSPENAYPAAISSPDRQELKGYATAPNSTMAPPAVSVAGGNQPHNNMPPFLGISFIICTEGLFPPRD